MGYGDYFPSGNQHHKKPLTKEQLRKLRENYQKGNAIAEHVQQLEEQEKEVEQKEAENSLKGVFL